MDPLMEVLRSVRMTGGVFLDAHFTAPWCVTSKVSPEDCAPYMPRPAQVMCYHYVVDGRMLLTVAREEPLEVRAGEVVLLPHNDDHTLASAPGLKAVSGGDLVEVAPGGGLARIVHGGGGAATHIVCGFLGNAEVHTPLIATLPKVLKVDIREATSRGWVEASIRYAADELAQGRFAPSPIISRLSELLLVEAVRHYAAAHGELEAGWLKGLGDPQVGKALALVHRDLARSWSPEELAREAALSRSAFIDRFTSLVGLPPGRYQTAWRMQTAKLTLRETKKTVAQIAFAVGYDSEEAFSRAFKREFGEPPARWRELAQAS